MNNTELSKFAEDKDIIQINGKLSKASSMSIMDNDLSCAIIMDYSKIHTEAEELVCRAHEIGHCETGAFYDENSLELRSRMEHRANRWAIKKLVPEDELIEAFESGILEIWELAEHFGVTEDFMKLACEFYGYYQRMS